MMDYPLGAKLRQHLEFYVKQLDYDQETGRVSTLEMLGSMFNAFPQVKNLMKSIRKLNI